MTVELLDTISDCVLCAEELAQLLGALLEDPEDALTIGLAQSTLIRWDKVKKDAREAQIAFAKEQLKGYVA